MPTFCFVRHIPFIGKLLILKLIDEDPFMMPFFAISSSIRQKANEFFVKNEPGIISSDLFNA
jgi:hypothetical protein